MSLKLVSKLALAALAALSISVMSARAGDGNIAQQNGKGYTPCNKGSQSVQSQYGKGKNNCTPNYKGKNNKSGFNSGNTGGNFSGNTNGNMSGNLNGNRNRNQ